MMYQNTVYICISWYSRICWFPAKKCWFQQKSRSVSRDSYYFLDLLWVRYNCAKFDHCRICVTDFKEGGTFLPPPLYPIHEQAQESPSWIGLKFWVFCFFPWTMIKNMHEINQYWIISHCPMKCCSGVLILLKRIPLFIWQQISKRYRPFWSSTLKFKVSLTWSWNSKC